MYFSCAFVCPALDIRNPFTLSPLSGPVDIILSLQMKKQTGSVSHLPKITSKNGEAKYRERKEKMVKPDSSAPPETLFPTSSRKKQADTASDSPFRCQ